MGIPQSHLGAGEHVILHLRTHMKAVFGRILLGIILTAALGGAYYLEPLNWHPYGLIAATVIWVVTMLVWVLWPILKWRMQTYTITNRRIITRAGVVNRSGHDLPLRRVNNVQYERDLLDRVLGCGTLILETAAEEPLVLHDVPRVERVHVQITEILFADADADGEPELLREE
ncbi:PH domain-containing protein [Schaalia sp. Marseille-Q2122]|uniref:PH domain-containing protein n=1 Tax=Schaalia sp. Marseille-Q2122 TaxID=2736604 RepID=UPI00158884A8|nr:PH domain-containing protein [Schaalia sp. Marseille-Q2122]